MAQQTKALMTAEEFARLPDDGLRRELVNGKVIERTPGGTEHSAAGVRTAALIMRASDSEGAGAVVGADCGFMLQEDPPTVRVPDAAFVRAARIPSDGLPAGFFPGAPDLAVEVVSPTDSASDLQSKVMEYLEAGTSLVWVVYPRTRQVVAYRPGLEATVLGETGELTAEPLLPGLSIPVAGIFAK